MLCIYISTNFFVEIWAPLVVFIFEPFYQNVLHSKNVFMNTIKIFHIFILIYISIRAFSIHSEFFSNLDIHTPPIVIISEQSHILDLKVV